MQVNNLEKVQINNDQQWVLVRGKNSSAPLIIQVQAGPGLPMISEANDMQKKLQWENDYLVAYWDQRACGKSYHKDIDPKSISFAQLTEDIVAITNYLLKKYNKDKAILVGYSMGATLSLLAASKNSHLYSDLFVVGMDIDVPTANKNAMDFITAVATERKNTKALKQIKELSEVPIINATLFTKRAKLVSDYGGVIANATYNQIMLSSVKNMLFTKAYKLSDIPKTMNGMNLSLDRLMPEMDVLNLFKKKINVNTPVHFIQGKKDAVAPHSITEVYFDFLSANNKTMDFFENSAHMPHLEESQKFYTILKTYTKSAA